MGESSPDRCGRKRCLATITRPGAGRSLCLTPLLGHALHETSAMVEQILGTPLDLAAHLIEGLFPLVPYELPLLGELPANVGTLLRAEEPDESEGSECTQDNWRHPT